MAAIGTVTGRTEIYRPLFEMLMQGPVSLRQAREAAGLSQRELARRMGTSQSAVVRLEGGGVGATLTTLQRVATALGLEVNVELRPSA